MSRVTYDNKSISRNGLKYTFKVWGLPSNSDGNFTVNIANIPSTFSSENADDLKKAVAVTEKTEYWYNNDYNEFLVDFSSDKTETSNNNGVLTFSSNILNNITVNESEESQTLLDTYFIGYMYHRFETPGQWYSFGQAIGDDAIQQQYTLFRFIGDPLYAHTLYVDNSTAQINKGLDTGWTVQKIDLSKLGTAQQAASIYTLPSYAGNGTVYTKSRVANSPVASISIGGESFDLFDNGVKSDVYVTPEQINKPNIDLDNSGKITITFDAYPVSRKLVITANGNDTTVTIPASTTSYTTTVFALDNANVYNVSAYFNTNNILYLNKTLGYHVDNNDSTTNGTIASVYYYTYYLQSELSNTVQYAIIETPTITTIDKLSFNLFKVTFNTCEGATEYSYNVSGPNNWYDNGTTSSPLYIYANGGLGDYTVTITAKNTLMYSEEKSDSAGFAVTKLDAPTVTSELEYIKWSDYDTEVNKATSYVVEGQYSSETEWVRFNQVSTLFYRLTHKDADKLTPGVHKFRVKAIAVDASTGTELPLYSSDWSNIIEIEVETLDTPVISFAYDTNGKQTSVVTWDAIDNALYYAVYLNDIQIDTTEDTSSYAVDDYVLNRHENNPGKYQISVMAMSDLVIYANSTKAKAIFYDIGKLNAPELVMSDSGLLTWTQSYDDLYTESELLKSSNSTIYDVYYNGDLVDSTYDTQYQLIIEPGTVTNIAWVQARNVSQPIIKPNPRHLSSDISNIVTAGKYPKITNIYASTDGYLYWDSVENANQYLVYNSDSKILTTYDTKYQIPANVPNTFYFTVQVARYDNIIASDMSDVVQVSITKLETPQVIIDAVNKIIEWDLIIGAESYDIYLNNKKITSTAYPRFDFSKYAKNGENTLYVIATNSSKLVINSNRSNIVKMTETVTYDYYVKIKEDNTYGDALQIEMPLSLNFKYDSSLDTATVTLAVNNRKEPYEAFTDIKICFNSENGVPFKTYYFIIAEDTVTLRNVGNKELYSHTLSLIERTRFLQSEIIPNMTVTQPQDFVVSEYRARGEDLQTVLDGGNTEMSTEFFSSAMMSFLTAVNLKGSVLDLSVNDIVKIGANGMIATGGITNLIPSVFRIHRITCSGLTGSTTGDNGIIGSNNIKQAIDKDYEFTLPYVGATQVTNMITSKNIYNQDKVIYTESKTITQRWYARPHVDKYEKDSNYPEYLIATYNYDKNGDNHPTFKFSDLSQYNSKIKKWDIILTIDDVEDMYWESEYYQHNTVGADDAIKAIKKKSLPLMIKQGASYVKFDNIAWLDLASRGYKQSELVSYRKVWSGIEVGDVNATTTVSSDVITIKDTLNKLCNIVNTIAYNDTPKYSIDSNILNLTAEMPCHQLNFEGKTMYECLEELGKEFMGIPYLIDETDVIGYHIVSDKTPTEYENSKTPISTASSIDNNATGFITEAKNMISKDYYEVYPAYNLWITPRASDGAAVISTATASIILDKPIAYIKKVELTNYGSIGTILDITPFIYEKTMYDSLDLTINGKGSALYWTIGDNKIQGLGTIPDISGASFFDGDAGDYTLHEKVLNTLGLSNDTYVINNIITARTAKTTSSDIVKDLKFRVTYIPYNETMLITEQFNTTSFDNNVYKVYNQTDNVISDMSFGNTASKELNRVGNNSIYKEFRTYSPKFNLLAGDVRYIDGEIYYVDNITYTIDNNIITGNVEFTKNANKINPRMGINSEYRQYEIYAKNYINRTLSINHYCYLSNDIMDTDSYKSTRTGIWPLVIENALAGSRYNTLSTIYVNVYGEDSNGSIARNSYTDYYGNTTTIDYGFALHATRLVTPNSVIFTGKMLDNYCAGYYADTSTTFNEKYASRAARYVDNFGKMKYIDIALCNPTINQLFTTTSAAGYLYPKTKFIEDVNQTSLDNCVYYDRLYVDKDNREALTFTYQLHFKANNPKFYIHEALTKYLFKLPTDESSIVGPAKIIGYKGIIDNVNSLSYTESEILGDVSIGITSDGVRYIKELSVTPKKDFDGYAVVYSYTPKAKGEILFHYGQSFVANETTTIEPTYFNFSDTIL